MTHASAAPAAPSRRAVHRRADLARLLDPRSIAIIGASPRPGSFGERTAANLARFAGHVFLVNGKYDRIGDAPCFPTIASLPEVPDCVVIAAAREAVEDIVQDCAAAGVGGAVIFASGYAETGKPERAAQQARLGAIAAEAGIRLVGPNCIGVVNYTSQARMSFSAVSDQGAPRPRAIGLISQSGALGFALAQGIAHGVSFSHVLTSGNSCDVDVADWIAALAEDPAPAVIACLFEGMPDPQRLIEAAAIAWAANKPIVINKLGTGEQGAAAALSHTGSLAGSDAAYRAAFDQAGIVVAESYESLLEMASFFAKVSAPKACGVAVLATSGGAAIMAADRAEAHGVELPQPAPEVRARLEARIPEFGSARNPCDVTAQVVNDLDSLADCAGALLGDPAYGALVYPYPYAYDSATQRIPWFSRLAAEHGKPVCAVWISENLVERGAAIIAAEPAMAIFRSMDRCFATLAAWHWREARRAAIMAPPGRLAPPEAAARAAALLQAAPQRVLTEREAKQVLACYGVPVVEERLAASADEAVAAAEALDFPVVLKVESPDIPHKTEAGVIRLDLRDAASVREAFAAVMRAAACAAPHARINGALVQPMVPKGVEIVVGARRDPLFGPLVLVGLGGVLTEVLRDTATALAPVGPARAGEMLRGLRGARILDGFRGAEAVDIEALAAVVARVSELAADQAAHIEELDVNPLICAGDRILAVDALIHRAPGGAA